MWLSGTWCTTCLTVHPPGRYGVSSCSGDRPATAARSCAGVSAIWSIQRPSCSVPGAASNWNFLIGYCSDSTLVISGALLREMFHKEVHHVTLLLPGWFALVVFLHLH